MNKAKKLFVISLIVFLMATSLPVNTEAKIIYGYILGRIAEPVDGIYVVIYEKLGYEKNEIVLREVHARRCYKTPTEFRITELDDPLIVTGRFDYNETNYLVKDLAALTVDKNIYAFAVTNDSTTKTVSFFVSYSNDTGLTWSDIKLIANTSVSDSYYQNFDVAYFNNKILLAYSYAIGNTNYTTVLDINPETLTVEKETAVTDYFGVDFKLYSYNDKLYLVSTDPNKSGVVRFTYSSDGYNLSQTVSTINPPYANISVFNPTITRWKDGFYIIGEDQLWGVVEQKALSEYFLWGRWIKDVGEDNTTSGYNVLGNKEFDGYYQKDPSASVYRGNIFVAFKEGRSITSSLTDLNFLFSSDGNTWLHQFSGSTSLIQNPGIIFAIATIACFAIVLPINFYISKKKKK